MNRPKRSKLAVASRKPRLPGGPSPASRAGGDPPGEESSSDVVPLLGIADIQIVKQGTKLPLGESELTLIPCPTPRWPDLVTVYSRKH